MVSAGSLGLSLREARGFPPGDVHTTGSSGGAHCGPPPRPRGRGGGARLERGEKKALWGPQERSPGWGQRCWQWVGLHCLPGVHPAALSDRLHLRHSPCPLCGQRQRPTLWTPVGQPEGNWLCPRGPDAGHTLLTCAQATRQVSLSPTTSLRGIPPEFCTHLPSDLNVCAALSPATCSGAPAGVEPLRGPHLRGLDLVSCPPHFSSFLPSRCGPRSPWPRPLPAAGCSHGHCTAPRTSASLPPAPPGATLQPVPRPPVPRPCPPPLF